MMNSSLYGRLCELHSDLYFVAGCYWHGVVRLEHASCHLIEMPGGQMQLLDMPAYSVVFTDRKADEAGDEDS